MDISKQMTNLDIAKLLRSVAASYKLKDELKNRFRIIAYERAADSIEHASSELKDLWDEGKLDQIPSVGKNISEHIDEIFRTGKSKYFDNVLKGMPPAMFEFMDIAGIGPKTAYRLAHELGIKSISELEKAAKKGHIAKLEGFGIKSEKEILQSLMEFKSRAPRHLLPYAHQIASEVVEWLKTYKDVIRVEPLGSLRRKVATVGDIDIAVSTYNAEGVLEYFTKYPKLQRIIEKGDRTSSIIGPGGVQIDLMVEKPESFGALLQHFTGSKHHNIALREFGLKMNLSLSDYGIYTKKGNKKVLNKIKTEEEFYNFLGMKFIPPELRENTGEIQASISDSLPNLIKIDDIKGDLQIHSDFNVETSHDLGESNYTQILSIASKLKYEYLAFTDHNPNQTGHTESQMANILNKKKYYIEQINYSLKSSKKYSVKKVFNSLEIDIKPDGTLPVSDKNLQTLDFALVSIHSSFKLNKRQMTKRVLTALGNSKVKIFAHPTARLLNKREGIELDWNEIFEFCLKNNKWIEINSDPMRLDLPDFMVREAVKYGVKMSLGTDAHHFLGLENMVWGVSVARRGWSQKKDIINTKSLEEFEKVLK